MGGAEKALLSRMTHAPRTVRQVLLNVRPEIDELEVPNNFEVCEIKTKSFNRFYEINTFLRNHYFDVIIVRTPLDVIRFSALKFFSKERTTNLVFEAHSNFVSKRFAVSSVMRVLINLLSKKVDLVIAVSENVKNGPLCHSFERIEVCYLGGESDLVGWPTTEANSPQLLYVGRLVALKRPLWLLERILAISINRNLPDNFLTIVGGGPLEADIKEFISAHKLERIVNFVGKQKDVSPYYGAATHLVSCSTNEGLPLTFFEAKLAGLCIIATPSGGGSEILTSEDFQLESFDAKEFEAALLKIITLPLPSLDRRKAIREESAWMRTNECTDRFYEILSNFLSK